MISNQRSVVAVALVIPVLISSWSFWIKNKDEALSSWRKEMVAPSQNVPLSFGMIAAPVGETATFRFDWIPLAGSPNETAAAAAKNSTAAVGTAAVSSANACPLQRSLHPHKPRVQLVVAITSGTFHKSRRDAARSTWLQPLLRGDGNYSVVYKFVTDDPSYFTEEERKVWQEEDELYGDIVYADTKPGFRHTEIFLSASAWFLQRYDFDWFLKLDDDMFVCLPHLLHEIAHRCEPYLYWGRYHCDPPMAYTSRMDEFFSIFGRDMIDFIWEHHENITCSPCMDQVAPHWFWELLGKDSVTMFDDRRISQLHVDWINHVDSNFCENFLVAHQCYEDDMKRLWNEINKTNISNSSSTEVPPVQFTCKNELKLRWDAWKGTIWEAAPIPCFWSAWPLEYDTGMEKEHYVGDENSVKKGGQAA